MIFLLRRYIYNQGEVVKTHMMTQTVMDLQDYPWKPMLQHIGY